MGGLSRSIYQNFPLNAWTPVLAVTYVRLHSICDASLIGAAASVHWLLSKDGINADACIFGGQPFALLEGLIIRQGSNLYVYNGAATGAILALNFDPIFFPNVQ